MIKAQPSFLGNKHKEQAERSSPTSGVLGGTAGALDILSCLEPALGKTSGDLAPLRDTHEIVRLTGLPRRIVCEQLTRLIRYGYIEEAMRERYRLSIGTLGSSEIVASSVHHSQTRRHRQTPGEKDATGSSR